jgi:hypothetical protein
LAELVGTKLLAWWLEKTSQRAKVLLPKKLLLVPILHVQPTGWSGTDIKFSLAKHSAQQKQGFEFKVSKAFFWGRRTKIKE